ncbi:hypothetical protein HDZ31DRAFT_68868 [Schizophyllum fasciatum]
MVFVVLRFALVMPRSHLLNCTLNEMDNIAKLNNHFQGTGQHAAVSWAERETRDAQGVSTWTVKCNVRGQTMGTASASTKTGAKNEAAKQALAALGAA